MGALNSGLARRPEAIRAVLISSTNAKAVRAPPLSAETGRKSDEGRCVKAATEFASGVAAREGVPAATRSRHLKQEAQLTSDRIAGYVPIRR